MCCEADWKREVVQDYKWDYIDVRDFRKTDAVSRLKYCLVYIMVFKAVAILGLDIFTCVTMISTDHWTNAVYSQCVNESQDCSFVKFSIARWVFVGCIIFSILLYVYEFYKARQVILSRDISYSFTNIMANDYYSLRDYNKYCLFGRLGQGKKGKDKVAFFVFFAFKDWKRTLLADGPRQCINGIILYTIAKVYDFNFDWSTLSKYWGGSAVTALLLFAMITTVLLFLIGFISLCIAAVLYVPLLCYIQGNLKEYVCHKVDKRIGDIMRRIQKQRIARNNEIEQKLAIGGTITNAKGEEVDASHLMPTLPQIDLDDDDYGHHKRPISPHSRALSPAPGARSMAPGPPRARSPGPNQFFHHQKMNSPPVTEEDIYDAYGTDKDRDSYPLATYGEDGTASKTSLLHHAAPPGLSYPPKATAAGAPSYPPSVATGAPSYPPRAAGPTPVGQQYGVQAQYEATRVGWGHAPPQGMQPQMRAQAPPRYNPANDSHGW